MTGSIGKFLFGSTVTLVTALDHATCVARLKEITSEGILSRFALRSRHSVSGSVGERKVHWRTGSVLSEGFDTHLSAVFVPQPIGTRIICRFRLHWSTRLVLSMMALAFVVRPLYAWFSGSSNQNFAAIMLMPLMGLFIFLLILAIGRVFARGQQDFMLDLIKNTLGAEEVDRPGSPPDGAALRSKMSLSPVKRTPTIERR